jgi:hypothetical protein
MTQATDVAMEGLEGSLIMAQAALNVKNKAIGGVATTEAATQLRTASRHQSLDTQHAVASSQDACLRTVPWHIFSAFWGTNSRLLA